MPDLRYIFNDDFEAPLTLAPPDSVMPWLRAWFDDLLSTPIDTYVGCAVWTDMLMGIDGKVGQRIGSRKDVRHPSAGYWLIEHVQQAMFAVGTDLLQLATEAAHARGKRCLLGVRVGDAHHGFGKGYDLDPRYPTFPHEHPELRLAKPDGSPDVALNYALPAVREHRLAVINEALSTHDVDGIELDFLRFGRFVPRPANAEGIAAMTQYVRDVAALLATHRSGVSRFGKATLGVRLPRRLDQCAAIGLDPTLWVREGLVDYLAPADFLFTDFALPLTDYLDLVRGTPCRVLFAIQPKPAAPWSDELRKYAMGFPICAAEYRALAATGFAQGAHGMHTFNLGYEMSHRRAETLQSLHDMRDAASAMNGPRHYQFFPGNPGADAFGDDRRQTLRFAPGNQTLQTFAFQCGEPSDAYAHRTLTWHIACTVPTDRWRFSLNGTALAADAVTARYAPAHRLPAGGWALPQGMHFSLDLPGNLTLMPRNELRIEAISLDPSVAGERVMELLEVFAK